MVSDHSERKRLEATRDKERKEAEALKEQERKDEVSSNGRDIEKFDKSKHAAPTAHTPVVAPSIIAMDCESNFGRFSKEYASMSMSGLAPHDVHTMKPAYTAGERKNGQRDIGNGAACMTEKYAM